MSNLTKEEINRIKAYLGGKLSEGKLILFTGAGFSSSAKDTKGRSLPLSNQLAKEISNLIGIEDPNPSLKDIYYIAMLRKKNKVSTYLKERLTVDSTSLKDEYQLLINQPWYKVYTVNIDDLFRAAQSKFNFDRRIFCVSSNTNNRFNIESPKSLVVTHLNGVLEDIPDKITFSQEQHSEKITIADSIMAFYLLRYFNTHLYSLVANWMKRYYGIMFI